MIIAMLILGGIGFFISLLIHISTFLGVGLGSSVPGVWWLHYGLILVFGLIWVYNKRHNAIERNHWKKAVECTPQALSVMFFIVLVCMIFYTSSRIYGTIRNGRIYETQGQKVLMKRGQVVRVLTDAEYALRKEKSLRAVSAIWMTAYLVPFNSAIGCMRLNKKKEELLDL